MVERAEYVVVGLGAWGSAAAYQLARRGADVVGLEQFELGHVRGASHDTSRILRHSYHTPGYVELTCAAYDDWADLERVCGERLVTVVGGLDLFPPDASVAPEEHTSSLAANGVPFELLGRVDVQRRFPQFRLPEGTVGLYQPRGAVVPAAKGTATLQRLAAFAGARLHERCPVTAVRDRGVSGVEVETPEATWRCRRLVVCADAWTNDVLAGLDMELPLRVTQEQFSYFAPADPEQFAPGRMPLWIWLGTPSFYGFPCYGEPAVKVAQDCGGPPVTGGSRSFDPDPGREALVAAFVAETLPDLGVRLRSKTCLYTLTPDRDFVLGQLPGHPAVSVAIGAGHGFKFTPTVGRLLAELATTGGCDADLAPYALDRPWLVDPPPAAQWVV